MTLSANRTLLLTERSRRVCRLPPADVAFLLAQHADHFELLPTARRHRYALTPGGYVGVIHTPTLRLLLRPKIPLVNVFFMLDPLSHYAAESDRSAPHDDCEAFDFLAGQLALRLRERIDAGLQRGYDERATTGSLLLGRLDLAAQMRDAPAHKERLHCEHDDFTIDVFCNRVVRSVAEVVLASPLLSAVTRTALQNALPALAEVQTIPLTSDVWDALAARPIHDYQPLLDVCRLLADSLAPGTIPGPTFLLNLEQVFERFLTRLITQAIELDEDRRVRFRAEVQPLIRVSVPVAGQPDLQVRPDVLLLRDDVPYRIIDAKWKRLGPTPLLTADVHQMLAYCSALNVRHAVLVYPGRRNRTWHYDLERTNCQVTVSRLRLIGDRQVLIASTRRLLHRLFNSGSPS